MTRVTVAGGGSYVGSELVRLLAGHDGVELHQVLSETYAGRPVASVLPHARDRVDLAFRPLDEAEESDVVLSALSSERLLSVLPSYAALSDHIIDLSPDFRVPDPAIRGEYYETVPDADDVRQFVPGLPEHFRAELKGARRVAVPGCMANAALLALLPLSEERLVAAETTIDARTGSSGGGRRLQAANHHAERSGVLRPYAFGGHRHEAEVRTHTQMNPYMYVTAVDAVRGVQTVIHTRLLEGVEEGDVRRAYKLHYADEPFVRLLHGRRGANSYPEPKLLSGSNYCDIAFHVVRGDRAVLVSALDNLMKGAAGNAVQCLNLMLGLPETQGLEFAGLYPI